MKFGFVTCVELGLSCMRAIYDIGGQFAFAITLPDDKALKKSGRVFLDDFCAEHAIPLFKTAHINDPACVAFLRAQDCDWLFIIGWSQIADSDVLTCARNGVVGIHPTLLPEGRGRAAIPWAILKGLKETGITMFQLDHGVDTGPILAQRRIPIAPTETATTLYQRIAQAHVELMRETWPAFLAGRILPVPQDHSRATVWPGRKPSDGEVTLAMSVEAVNRMVRAVTRPYPGAFLRLEDGSLLRIWAGRIIPPGTGAIGAHILTFVDGDFEVLSGEIEPQPSATGATPEGAY